MKVIAEAISATQPYVARERTAVLAAIDAIRKDALEQMTSTVDQQRLETLEFIHGERLATMKDAEQIALKIADHTFRQV